MTLNRRTLLAAGAIAPFVGLREARGQRRAGNLVFALATFPPNLLPWVHTGTAAITVKNLVYRGLLSFNAEGAVQGELAESWAADGPNAWVFRLRSNAVFHNGQPVTSEDVKWTVERIQAERSPAYLRTEFGVIERVETPDPRTVRLVLRQTVATMPMLLAMPHSGILARGTGEGNVAPVGAGPYTIRAQERGSWIELAAFDRYYKQGRPRARVLRFVNYADENARVAALQAGDVDMIEYTPWQSMGPLEADQRFKQDNTDGPYMALAFNGQTGPFRDHRLRRAVGFAIRREEIVQAAFFGRGTPLGGIPIPRGTEFWNEERANYWRYDPARARALMAEAGVAGGFNCTLLSTAQFGMHKSTAEVVQAHLGEIGIRVTLNLPDWAQRVNLGGRGQYEFVVQGQTAEYNDPDGLAGVLNSDLGPNISRSFNVPTPKIAALFARGRAELDQARRREIYAELERVALEEETPLVGLCWRSQGYAMYRDVNGFRNLPGALTFYSGFTLEDAVVG